MSKPAEDFDPFTVKNIPLALATVDLLASRQPDTVRGVMYALVSTGWLPDTSKKSYARAQRLLNDLRKKGVVPFSWIVDNIRATDKPSSWSGLEDFADTVRSAYRRDFWAELPEYVAVIVEKDTVAGRIAPVTHKYDVPMHPLRGYASTSYAWEIAEQWRQIRKPINAVYIGDHDPSGRDIERNIRQVLSEYSGRDFTWRRLAVNPEDFDQYDIIPLEPKLNDRRYRQFADEFGDRCAEVEAIPADVLRDRVEAAILDLIPAGAWAKLQQIEEQERQTWAQVMERIGGRQ